MLGDGCAGCCRSLPPVQSEPSWDQAAWFIDTLGSGNIGNIPAYQPGNQTIRFNVLCNVFCIISYLNIKRESNRYNWVLFGLGSESCKLVDLFTILIISLDPLFWFSFVAFIRNIGENSETRCKWVKDILGILLKTWWIQAERVQKRHCIFQYWSREGGYILLVTQRWGWWVL